MGNRINKLNTSPHFIYYDEKFFVYRLWKSEPSRIVMENYNTDSTLTEQERQYFKEEYSEIGV
jgi:hypothetical protein